MGGQFLEWEAWFEGWVVGYGEDEGGVLVLGWRHGCKGEGCLGFGRFRYCEKTVEVSMILKSHRVIGLSILCFSIGFLQYTCVLV